MSRWLLALAVAVAFALGCDKKEEPVATTPTATATPAAVVSASQARGQTQLEFLAVALVEQRDTLDQVTCHCCGKSIAQCYQDTLVGAEGACPPT